MASPCAGSASASARAMMWGPISARASLSYSTRLTGRRKVWVAVVAHPRKLQKDAAGKYEEVDEYTVSGSAHWANVCDFLLSVKRVFPQELADGDAGSANPSYTVVSVLKVRDQEICHTGRMYYIRMASGRYVEMKGEKECQEYLRKTIIHGTDLAAPWIDVR